MKDKDSKDDLGGTLAADYLTEKGYNRLVSVLEFMI